MGMDPAESYRTRFGMAARERLARAVLAAFETLGEASVRDACERGMFRCGLNQPTPGHRERLSEATERRLLEKGLRSGRPIPGKEELRAEARWSLENGDLHLVIAARAGDSEALCRLHRLTRYALRGDREKTDLVFSDLYAMDILANYCGRGGYTLWVRGVARRRCAATPRPSTRLLDLPELPDTVPPALDRLILTDERRTLRAALLLLPRLEAKMVQKRDWCELPFRKIAAEEGFRHPEQARRVYLDGLADLAVAFRGLASAGNANHVQFPQIRAYTRCAETCPRASCLHAPSLT